MQRLRLSSLVSLTSDIFYKTFFFSSETFCQHDETSKTEVSVAQTVRDRSPLVLGCEVERYGGLERPIRRGTQF